MLQEVAKWIFFKSVEQSFFNMSRRNQLPIIKMAAYRQVDVGMCQIKSLNWLGILKSISSTLARFFSSVQMLHTKDKNDNTLEAIVNDGKDHCRSMMYICRHHCGRFP